MGEWRYSSIASRHGRFTPGERAPGYPLIRMLGGPNSRSGHGDEETEIRDPLLPGIEHQSSSPLPSQYTDWATRTPDIKKLQVSETCVVYKCMETTCLDSLTYEYEHV